MRRRAMTEEGRVPQTLTVPLGDFGSAAVRDAVGPAASLESVVRQALYHYMADAGAGRAGWLYPRFVRAVEAAAPEVEVALGVDSATWERFVHEADRQHVSVERLVRHAVLYFAAELEAGRVARRILDDLS